jgi:hypothetical protein
MGRVAADALAGARKVSSWPSSRSVTSKTQVRQQRSGRWGASIARRAKKVGKEEEQVQVGADSSASWEQWLSLADGGERGGGSNDDKGKISQELINEVSNRALKAMLQERDTELVEVMFDLENLESDWKERDADAAAYLRVLLLLLSHEYEEYDFENSDYKLAIARMYALLEDSGWKLTQLGSEHQQDLMDDELLQPPPSFSTY